MRRICAALVSLLTATAVTAQPSDAREITALRALVNRSGDGARVEGFLGAYVAYFEADTSDAHLKELAALRLPDLTAVHLRPREKSSANGPVTGVTAAGLKELAALPDLRLVSLSYRCRDEDLKAIAGIKTLEAVWVRHGWTDRGPEYVTPKGLGYLAELPKLRSLRVHVYSTEAGWEPIAKCRNLEVLHADLRTSGKGMSRLAGLPKLRDLHLGSTSVDDAGAAEIATLKSVRRLELFNTKVTDEGLKHLGGMTDLQVLDLGTNKLTDAGARHLTGMTSLQSLNLNFTQVGDEGAKAFAGMPALRGLHLTRTRVGDIGVKALAGHGELVNLDLSGTAVTDDGFKELTKLKKLYLLDVVGTKVTPEAVARFKTALPKCNVAFSRPSGGPK